MPNPSRLRFILLAGLACLGLLVTISRRSNSHHPFPSYGTHVGAGSHLDTDLIPGAQEEGGVDSTAQLGSSTSSGSGWRSTLSRLTRYYPWSSFYDDEDDYLDEAGWEEGSGYSQKEWMRAARKVKKWCRSEHDRLVNTYGSANLRLARSYTGSGARLKKALEKAMLGEQLVVSAIGGSVTEGFQVNHDEIWFSKVVQWMNQFMPPDHFAIDNISKDDGTSESPNTHIGVNGAIPATGSDYFSFCHSLHIPNNSSIIFIELSINDEYDHEHVQNMENLLRSLLELPQEPAVVLVQAIELHSAGIANGGDIHLPVAVYYVNYWQDPDLRHISSRGHSDLSQIVVHLLNEMACEHSSDILSGKVHHRATHFRDGLDIEAYRSEPSAVRPWGPWRRPKEHDLEPEMQRGVWSAADELGSVPRLRYKQHWDENTVNLPLNPQCYSTRSEEFPLTPRNAHGWSLWSHQDRPDKVYLYCNTTGSSFDFEVDTRLGVIKMYSLRSKTFGLGSIECTVDGSHKSRIDGYWDNGNANIGRFSTLAEGITPGSHLVHCTLLEDTADPGGGHEFRVISIMSL